MGFMGEAKRRKENREPVIYHHTSTLRTNLIWMSGLIELEGVVKTVPHPELGKIESDVFMRRAFKDFPPLAWFTTQIEIPKCLNITEVWGHDKKTGEKIALSIGEKGGNCIALHRIAIGFPILKISVIPWTEHFGFKTDEGKELNESALEVGDNPEDWYVSESPVDVAKASEIWTTGSILNPRLRRNQIYLNDILELVNMCRTQKGVYVPPAWAKTEHIAVLAKMMNVPLLDRRP
jgi:hypothetical protein